MEEVSILSEFEQKINKLKSISKVCMVVLSVVIIRLFMSMGDVYYINNQISHDEVQSGGLSVFQQYQLVCLLVSLSSTVCLLFFYFKKYSLIVGLSILVIIGGIVFILMNHSTAVDLFEKSKIPKYGKILKL